MKKLLSFLCLTMMIGCTTRIPTGFIGMVEKPSGLTGVVLAPGKKFVGPDQS